jgi:hypothetical protein
MEMPITVIITLFVAVVVGIVIINLASDLITDSKSKLDTWNDEGVDDEKIIELDSVLSTSVANLAAECYKKYYNQEAESAVCFVVLGDVSASESEIVAAYPYSEDSIDVDLSNAKNAVRIGYDFVDNKIKVKG